MSDLEQLWERSLARVVSCSEWDPVLAGALRILIQKYELSGLDYLFEEGVSLSAGQAQLAAKSFERLLNAARANPAEFARHLDHSHCDPSSLADALYQQPRENVSPNVEYAADAPFVAAYVVSHLSVLKVASSASTVLLHGENV